MPSIARGTLDAARFFIARAEEAIRGDSTSLRHYLEAAIVFARSVTFHIQSEFSASDGFDQWYSTWQDRLKRDAVAKYVLNKRNFVLKVGRVGLAHEVRLAMGEISFGSDFAVTRIVRAEPWYRRSPRTLWQDAVRPSREFLARRRKQRERTRRQQIRLKQAQSAVSNSDYRVRFVDSPVADCSATDLLTRYLDTLEELVADAEGRFGHAGS